jgi:exodeoxyribonuclease VII small subunit
MKKELTYNEAFDKLEEIVELLEEGDIPLDKLSAKVKQANEFIAICENRLRSIQDEIKEATTTTTTRIRNKK